jgi:hypothetical protein
MVPPTATPCRCRSKTCSGTGFLTGVTSIAAGDSYSLALTTTGLFVWRRNYSGQLGNGPTPGGPLPVAGVNFQPSTVSFGGTPEAALTASGNNWSVTVPPAAPGFVDVLATANVFGGITAAIPATVTRNAGTFSYVAAVLPAGQAPSLAPTGLSDAGLPLGTVVIAVGVRVLALLTVRRRNQRS